MNSFLSKIINLSIKDLIRQLLPEPVSPIIMHDSFFLIFKLPIDINILSFPVPILASTILMAYLSSKFLVIFEFKPIFIFKNFAILLVDT